MYSGIPRESDQRKADFYMLSFEPCPLFLCIFIDCGKDFNSDCIWSLLPSVNRAISDVSKFQMLYPRKSPSFRLQQKALCRHCILSATFFSSWYQERSSCCLERKGCSGDLFQNTSTTLMTTAFLFSYWVMNQYMKNNHHRYSKDTRFCLCFAIEAVMPETITNRELGPHMG